MSRNADLSKIFKALEQQGFTIERTRTLHWLVRNKEGRAVATLSGSGGRGRGDANGVAALRRAGFVWGRR